MNDILIIGGNGFIGKFLIDAIILNGRGVDVVTRSCLYSYCVGASDCVDELTGHIKPINELDLSQYQVIVYLAWGTKPLTASKEPIKDITDSLLFGLEWLDKLSKLRKTPLFIFISSGGSVYGEKNILCKESDRLNPINPYGIGKSTFENYLQYYSSNFGLPVIILRPSNIYGPYDVGSNQGVIQNFILNALRSKSITVWGSGQAVRDYLHINDFVEIMILLVVKKTSVLTRERLRHFNVGSGVGYSVNEIADFVASHFDNEIHISHINSNVIEPSFNVLDISRAEMELQWKPRHNIHSGIVDVISYFRGNTKICG